MNRPATSAPARPALEPLDTFYREAGRPLSQVRAIPAAEVPEPYRRLLVHNTDMTSTLEGFHGDSIHLEVQSRRRVGNELWREVVLRLDASGAPVEFGAIRIRIDLFPENSREEILGCHRPLGAILNASGIAYTSRPTSFFAFEPDPFIREALHLDSEATLYGRCNALRNEAGEVLAEIVEILPPT